MIYNEQDLLTKIRQGDQEAFTVIYSRYQPMLHLEAYYKVNQHQEAEDIVQEVFTSLWKRRKEIDINTSLKSFLYKAVHFQFTTRLRKKKSNRKFIATTAFSDVEEKTGLNSLEKKELKQQLQTAINNITSATNRNILQLAYLQQKSHKEIAEELKLQVHIVKNQASRGIKFLRASFTLD